MAIILRVVACFSLLIVAESLATSKTPLVDQAVAIYQKRFPAKTGSRTRPFYIGIGMPNRDLDGTRYQVANAGDPMGKTFAERDEKDLRATFNELAKIYGLESAFKMVKDDPIVLAANRKYFLPSLKAFSKTFGEEDARAMIKRNPGLLFLKPSGAGGADSADKLTMRMSYVVALTKPAGPLLLYGMLSLLMVPTLEALTGVHIRESVARSFGL